MGNLKHVQPGQDFDPRASEWNAFVDAAIESQKRNSGLGAAPPDYRHSGIVSIKNVSGSNVDRFGVLGISGTTADPAGNPGAFKARIVLTGATPAAATHAGKFAVLLEPIPTNAIGLAMVEGVAPVQINVTDASHQFADVTDGDATQLTSSSTGSARILWKPAGTGTLWAVVALQAAPADPATASTTTLGSGAEGTDTADTATWTRGSGVALDLWAVSRFVYNDAGDQVLYAMMRKLSFDPAGKLKTVSGETRVNVDTPDICQ